MQLPRPVRPAALVAWLLLFAVPSLWLGVLQLGRGIDTGNAAMKAAGTPTAAATAAVRDAFGPGHPLLLCFVARAGLAVDAAQQSILEALATQLGTLPGVAKVANRPAPAPDLALVEVTLADDDLATAERAVELATAATPSTMELRVTGLPLFEAALAQAIAGERDRVVPWITGVLFVLGWILFGNLRTAIALLLPALAAIAWTGGLLRLFGRPLDPVGVLLEPVLMTVGVAGAVHFVLAHERAARRGHRPVFCAAFAARSMRGPAMLAAATTMVGFLALAGNSLPAVAGFGVHAAFGTALANVFCFALLPSALQLCGRARLRPAGTGTARAFTDWLQRRSQPWLLGIAAATAVACTGWAWLRVDNDPLTLLAPEHRFRADHEALVRRLGGVDVFDLLVREDSPAQAPERLLPYVASVVARTEVAGLAGPPQRAASGEVRLPLRLRPGGSGEREALFEDLQVRADLLGLDGVAPAGGLVQMALDSGHLVRGQMVGLVATFGCLLLCLCIGFRSLRTGLAAILPSLLPCILLYGWMGLVGQPVSVATAMIGSVMLGLVVDNTIHFVHHYRHAQRMHPVADAVRRAMAEVGRPMWMSCVVLAAGFAVSLFGTMRSTVEFGALATAGMLVALVANAIVLPAAVLANARERSGDAANGRLVAEAAA